MPEAHDKTERRRIGAYRDRWSGYESSAGIVELSDRLSLDELRSLELFQDYKDPFLKNLVSDVSIAVWKSGAVLFEEGSYVDVAFFVLEGDVELILGVEGAAPVFDAHRTVAVPQVSGGADKTRFETLVAELDLKQEQAPEGQLAFLNTVDQEFPADGRLRLGPGEMFGEIGALSGWPQSVSARVSSQAKLVQIRVPALRQMRRRSKELKQRLDDAYRSRTLMSQLRATPLLAGTSEALLRKLAQRVELVSLDPGEVLVEEGDPADSLFLVRSGFLKLTQQVGPRPMTVTYLSKGMTFGESELLLKDKAPVWTVGAASVQYSEMVKIPGDLVAEVLGDHVRVEPALWESSLERLKEIGRARRDVNTSELLDTALETGLIQGTSVLIIDLETCTRCDDCVRACASTHGGTPRFVREGQKIGNLMVTQACYHCRDPLCLVGCPTGAIRRSGIGNSVTINEALCIGCGKCEASCPYDVITMHDTGEQWPGDTVPEGLRGKDKVLAKKCDLCAGRSAGPACVEQCPNHCAVRIDSVDAFQALQNREED